MKETRNVTLLLVDDDSVDRELFMDALSSLSFNGTAFEAAGGKEALDRLRANQAINFVVLDLNMPLMDGRQTLKELKASKELKHIPVIILSTSNSDLDVTESYESGACLFMEKPHDFDELKDMLRCMLIYFNG